MYSGVVEQYTNRESEEERPPETYNVEEDAAMSSKYRWGAINLAEFQV